MTAAPLGKRPPPKRGEPMGVMLLADCPTCGGNVAMTWVTPGMRHLEVKETVGDWYIRRLAIRRVDRCEGDPLPEPCVDRFNHADEPLL